MTDDWYEHERKKYDERLDPEDVIEEVIYREHGLDAVCASFQGLLEAGCEMVENLEEGARHDFVLTHLAPVWLRWKERVERFEKEVDDKNGRGKGSGGASA